jgi:hypothetical protein
MELRDRMLKVALESPAYGYRRITAESDLSTAFQKRGRGFSLSEVDKYRLIYASGNSNEMRWFGGLPARS